MFVISALWLFRASYITWAYARVRPRMLWKQIPLACLGATEDVWSGRCPNVQIQGRKEGKKS